MHNNADALSSKINLNVISRCTSNGSLLQIECTLLRVGGDGGAHAVGADALNRSRHRQLLQAAFEVAVLSL